MLIKNCDACGKIFQTNKPHQKYCSSVCRVLYSPVKVVKPKITNYRSGQLCWSCANATGKCSWSQSFIPVEGWVAKPKITKDPEGNINTYKIISCPQFIRG